MIEQLHFRSSPRAFRSLINTGQSFGIQLLVFVVVDMCDETNIYAIFSLTVMLFE